MEKSKEAKVMIPFANEFELRLAVLRIEIQSTTSDRLGKSTGWLASEEGHIISCGHVFDGFDQNENLTVIAWLPDNSKAHLIIIEVGDSSVGLDYSILKIDPGQIHSDARLLRIWTGRNYISREQKVIGCGYPVFEEPSPYEGISVPWTGTVVPGYSMVCGKSCCKVNCDSDSTPEGHSGGAVLLRRTSKIPVVMGIQILADNDFVRFALPVSHLRENSPEFREILSLQDPWLKFEFLRSLNIQPTQKRLANRNEGLRHFCLTLHSHETFTLEQQVKLQTMSSRANEESKLTLNKILQGKLPLHVVPSRVHLEPVFAEDNIELNALLNFENFDDNELSRLRLVIDLSDRICEEIVEANLTRHSHLVLLDYSKEHLKQSIAPGYPDLRILANQFEPDDAIAAICSLIHDIDVDSGFFYSIALLPTFYVTPDQRQLFSQEKAIFLSRSSKSPTLYGIPTDFENLPYLPFGGVLRKSMNGTIDPKKLRALWLDFLWHLFRPDHGKNTLMREHCVSTIDDLLRLITIRWPKMRGRLSICCIRGALDKCPSSPTSLRFFVLCVRAPRKSNRATASMKQVFRKSLPPSPGQFVIIDGIEVLGLAGISPFVEILSFEFREVVTTTANEIE